jgi:hypothetical protein
MLLLPSFFFSFFSTFFPKNISPIAFTSTLPPFCPECMPSPPPAPRRHPRLTRNQRIARREARERQPRDSPRSTDNSAFLQLASLQFESLARQTTTRHICRSRSPLRDNRRRSRSRFPPRRSATNRRLPENHREPPTPQSVRNSPSEQYHNPFTVTQDRDPHPEAGATARPSPEAEESVIGWNDYNQERQPENNIRRTDSYRPAYGRDTPGGRGRTTRGGRGNRRPRGNRGPARSLFSRITPRN